MANVIVTGEAKGIGKACTEYFLNQGDSVIVLDLDKETLDNLNDGHGKLESIICDVSKNDEVKAAIEKGISEIGEIDVLVNNAGFQFYHIRNHRRCTKNVLMCI